jgi:D-serine dehydratase
MVSTASTPPPRMLDALHKGYPPHWPSIPITAAGAQGWQLLRGDLPLPLAVLKESALAHNLKWMREFCAERGLDIAPHGKTTMSPELYARQIEAGAWGITFATVFQAAVGVRHGIKNIIIANQVFQGADLDALVALQTSYPGVQIYFLVDSLEQVSLIESWQRARRQAARMPVLLEIGIAGKRTGVRAHEDAMRLAHAIAVSPAVRLAGIESYEGGLATCNHDQDRPAVAALMERVQAVAMACEQQGYFSGDEVLLSAGGSAIFDLVAKDLKPRLTRPARGILRSGCYLTHDHLQYRRHLQCVGERLNLKETLRPALEVLSAVQSCPEPGLALVTMGRRDVSYDIEMPVPIWRASLGDSATRAAPEHWKISALNDQHGYLRYDPSRPIDEHPRVGMIVGCGISHPCTTFDKWRWMPVVDEGYRVIDAVSLHF